MTAHGIATSRASEPVSTASHTLPAPRERSSATSMRRWSTSSRAVRTSAYAASSSSCSTGTSMVDRATRAAWLSWVSISGRRLKVSHEGQSRFRSSPRFATTVAKGLSRSWVRSRRSGTAVQVTVTLVEVKRARKVSRGTMSGP